MKLLLVASALLLSACTIRGPSIAVRPIEVSPLEIGVEGGHEHHRQDRGGDRYERDYHDDRDGYDNFCPPGQAKKGNCR